MTRKNKNKKVVINDTSRNSQWVIWFFSLQFGNHVLVPWITRLILLLNRINTKENKVERKQEKQKGLFWLPKFIIVALSASTKTSFEGSVVYFCCQNSIWSFLCWVQMPPLPKLAGKQGDRKSPPVCRFFE
jgi:hypothetical protein